MKPIHAHDLALLNWYMSHLSGTASLPNGGLVLAAVSENNSPQLPTLKLALAQLENPDARDAQRDPFKAYDERVLHVLDASKNEAGGVEVQRLAGVSKGDARALMEYWARSGLLRARVDEGLVGEKWTVSGGGVVGELERAVVLGGM